MVKQKVLLNKKIKILHKIVHAINFDELKKIKQLNTVKIN